MSVLLSMEKCNNAVMDFLAVTDVGKFLPKQAEELDPAVFLLGFRPISVVSYRSL